MKDVEKLIKETFDRPKIKRINKKCINLSYIINSKNHEFVFRYFPSDNWKVKKEKFLYNLINKKTDIPVPKVFKTGKDFIILSKLKGKHLSLKDKKQIEKAGEYLAKLHNIKFDKFGWIIADKIKPSFNNWVDFLEYDLNHKIKKAKNILDKKFIEKIKHYFNKNKKLLVTKEKPCLLHKDYHFSHILVDKDKITGIIDLEWAIAGHSEMDLAKSCLWMFDNKKQEKIFLKGYKKYNKISKDFEKRRKIYDLLTLFSSLIFSCELKHKKWYDYNMKKIKVILNGKHN